MRGLLLTLAGILGSLIAFRLVRLVLWLALRPGGWAVLVAGAVLGLTLTR